MTEQAGHVVHVNSATLLMGTTGTGKSALEGTLAEWVWETYGKVTRLYTSDGGGFPSNVQALMRLGIMQVFRMRTRDLPDGSLSFETCLRSTQGWWPRQITPSTGEVPRGIAMVPPITERYQMFCVNGHLVKQVPFASLLTASLCPQCRVMTDKSNARVVKESQTTPGFEQVGAVCFDGLTSMLSWMMSDMSQRSGRLELKGEEGAIGGKINSGDLKIGGSSRSHYGFAQSRAEEMVLNSLSIPGLVVPPVFTALTMETMDEGDLSVRGPLLIGKAKTAEAGAWFGDCLEAMVLKNDKDERIYRLALSEFVDGAGVRHLVKNRAAPGTMPPYLEDPPLKSGTEAQTAFTQFNLGVFYSLRDQARVVTEAAMDARFPRAPGLPAGMVEVGEGTGAGTGSAAGTLTESPGGQPPAVSGGPRPTPAGFGGGATGAAAGGPVVAPRPAPPAPKGGKPQVVVKPLATKPQQAQPAQPIQSPPPVATPAEAAPEAGTPSGAAPASEEAEQEEAQEAAQDAPAEVPAAQQAQVAQVAPVARPAQQAAGGAPRQAWAPPGAPRPPAQAPRVGAPKPR